MKKRLRHTRSSNMQKGGSDSSKTRYSSRMEKGIICGYTAILNTSELGMVTLITKIKTRPGYSVEEVGKEIAKLDESCCIHHVTCDFDLLVISKCVGHEKCGAIIEKKKEIEGVESVDAELVLKTMKEELKVEL